MSILTVGSGQQYSTIAAAVNAAQSGDTVNVQAGTYRDDFVNIQKDLTLHAVGGSVTMQATVQPTNGKAILTEGGSGVTVNIDGFAFTGASVPDQNGAGIRYEGGTLNVTNSHFYNNENGILGGADPNGVIRIDHSEFDHNGINGDGHTHNMYIGDIASFSLTNSFSHDANIGHEVKSRAENNTITGNTILDNNSSSSYEIDLPNAGNSVISGNTIEQGPNSQNPNIIAYGEEGNWHGTSLSVTGNTIVNDMGRGPALWNATGTTAAFANNSVYGFGGNALVNGRADQSGTTVLNSRPTLVQSVPANATFTPVPAPTPVPVTPTLAPVVTPTPTPTPVVNPATPSSKSGLVLSVSEDAYQGDAKFTVSVDGQQVGGTYTATASHGVGATQTVALGALGSGQHQIGVSFINDKWDGTSSTDRNLYVDSATYNGTAIPGSDGSLMSNGTMMFAATGDQAPAPPPSPVATPTPTSTPVVTPTPVPTAGLVVNVAEDAYQGDAQFTISVDGQRVGGVHTATALHNAGQSQAISVTTVLGGGNHQIGVSFINDAWGGTPDTDRNLYVTGSTYNGQNVAGSTATLLSNGTATFGVTNSTSSSVTLNMSEDAYQGDAQFTVAVDGKQMGGTYTATASHGAGQSQAITLSGITEHFTPHDIAVTFLNDKWDGTPSTDRNLYVNSIQFDNQPMAGSAAALMSAVTQHFTAIAPSNWTG